ncbi:MAG: cupin [bacterium]|nr:cupin [bacterium]
MTLLTFPDSGVRIDQFEAIQAALAERGVPLSRWEAAQPLQDDDDQATILAAYEHELKPFMSAGGYQSCDVINVHAETPNLETIREKFLSEHTHSEDEVRFFVDGQGEFWFHFEDGVVASLMCQRGDFLSVPKGTKHWFELAPAYHVKAIRIFTNPDGWVAQYTDSGTDLRYRQ